MLETRKDVTFTGRSCIEKTVAGSTEKKKVEVAFFSASIPSDGSSVNINKSIQNTTEYVANKKTCDADMAEFEK